MLRFTDTLTKQTVDFEPRDPGKVSMYACGPTVYDVPHLGHARTALTYDVIRRYLTWSGYKVTLVANITDIDDNIINRAKETGTTEPELAKTYADIYIEQMRRFGIIDPDHRPRATQYVDKMVELIEELLAKDAAYEISGSGVYFRVAKFDDYGALVHRTADDLRESAQARVDIDEDKEDPLDFALWKAAKPGEPTWDSPWGAGRPGWHIECAAMATDILGENFDIHGGGTDLAFPHHENERSESEAAGRPFARYWIHSAMLNVGGQKMGKSLGNFKNLGEAMDTYGERPLRFAFLQANYSTIVELGEEALQGATGGMERIDAFFRRLKGAQVDLAPEVDATIRRQFAEAMDNSFDTPAALVIIFDQISVGNQALDSGDNIAAGIAGATAHDLLEVLGLAPAAPALAQEGDSDIDALLVERRTARENKDFARADEIRDELVAQGIEIEDTAAGTMWRRV